MGGQNPEWADDCIRDGWDYEARSGTFGEATFYPVQPEASVGFIGYFCFFIPIVISLSLWMPSWESQRTPKDVLWEYKHIIFNIILILLSICIIIYNVLTLPKLSAYTEGSSSAYELLSAWDIARFFNLWLPVMMYCIMIYFITPREDSINQNEKSAMQIKQVDEVNRKLRLIQPHISETIIEEIESELYQLNIDLTSETIRNQDLEKTISKLQAKISTLEKNNPQISQNVNITIRDSVVMDTSFDNSINNNKQK